MCTSVVAVLVMAGTSLPLGSQAPAAATPAQPLGPYHNLSAAAAVSLYNSRLATAPPG